MSLRSKLINKYIKYRIEQLLLLAKMNPTSGLGDRKADESTLFQIVLDRYLFNIVSASINS
jgi:hypothetical protein